VSERLYPLRFEGSLRAKIWGSRDLSPYFETPQKPIGEAWYTFEENVVVNGDLAGQSLGDLLGRFGRRLMGERYEPRAARRLSANESLEPAPSEAAPYFPILTKLLFVSETLSVQVHPGDEYALAREGGAGKMEMWYVVDAEPGAAAAMGLTERLAPSELAAAAKSGLIADLLNWVEVRAGDTLFVPPGTLHTLGAGLTICEIQQNSDITYRLFDFDRLGDDGRPRDLHLGPAVAVVSQEPWEGVASPAPLEAIGFGRELLAACRYFAAERLSFGSVFDYVPDRERAHILIFTSGEGWLGQEAYSAGDSFLIPAEAEPFRVRPGVPTTLIRAYEPDLEKLRAEVGEAGAVRE